MKKSTWLALLLFIAIFVLVAMCVSCSAYYSIKQDIEYSIEHPKDSTSWFPYYVVFEDDTIRP